MNTKPFDDSSTLLKLWDRALTDEEVRQDYELSRGCTVVRGPAPLAPAATKESYTLYPPER